MNLIKQNLYIYIITLALYQSCCGFVDVQKIYMFENCFTTEAVKAAAPIVANATEKLVVASSNIQTGLASVGTGIGAGLKTGLIYVGVGVGVGLAVVAVAGGSYYGYRQYCKHCDKIAKMKLAREIMEREMRIKEEQARIALETMQKNARIRNNVLIGVATTVTGIGLGYALYRLYRSIQERRQQKKQEQQLSSARQELIITLEEHGHEQQVGYWGVPTACEPCLHRLLALQGSGQALEEIANSRRNLMLLQNPSALIATAPQPQ